MFVKIERYIESDKGVVGNDGSKVVPKERKIYEVDSVTYKKLGINFLEELEEILHLETSRWGFVAPFPAADLENGTIPSPVEVIIVEMWKDGKSDIVVAPQCALFIMNEEGKTIDSLYCR